MLAQGGIAGGRVIMSRQILVGGRQPVGAMLGGSAAKLPERFLKTLGQSREALASLNGFDILPAAVG
jgi:hypothetical protein